MALAGATACDGKLTHVSEPGAGPGGAHGNSASNNSVYVPTPDGEVDPGDPTPQNPRVVRLDEESYEALMATFLFGRAPDAQTDVPSAGITSLPFEWYNPADRFTTKYDSYLLGQTEFSPVELNARLLASQYIDSFDSALCAGADYSDDTCQRVALADVGERLLRRPITDEDVDTWMAMSLPDATPREAFELRLRAVLMHPETLFRAEIGPEAAAGDGVALTSFELASALAFTLTRRPPDELLWQAAVDGSLTDNEVLEGHIDRLMQTGAYKGRVKQFLAEYWRYPEATNIPKDHTPEDVFPDVEGAGDARYRPQRFVDETDLLIDHLVENDRNRDFFYTMLTTDKAFVSRDTAIFYNTTSEADPDEPELVTLPADQRQGIMMQPSWLVAFSEPDHNSPIRRGLFMQESMLCGNNPEVPVDGVPPLVTSLDEPLRETLALHLNTETSCGGCHLLMDPLAMPFEQFDDFGRHRTMEAGAPVDTTGVLTWSGGQLPISGPVADPYELVEKLGTSSHVTECFLAHTFRFWVERDIAEGDEPTVIRARFAYESAGGDFDAALKSILMSSTFRRRIVR
jgi:hypothetical protein